MVIGGKYELGEIVGENEESRTFAARDVESGHRVLVHQILEPLLETREPPLPELAQRCAVGRGGVIEKLNAEGADYIVTEAREGFRDARELLEKAAIVPPPAPQASGEDRFTRVGAWRVPASFSAPPAPAEPREPSVSGIFGGAPKQEEVAAPSQQPGGFTSMFQTPAAPPVPEPAPPLVSREPSEFTSMFQASPPAAGPMVAPPTPPAPGGFTKMFQAPEPVSSAPAKAPAAKSEPGEFTRYFQSASASVPFEEHRTTAPPQPYAAPPPAARPPGEYTRLFQMPAPAPGPAAPGSGATHVFVTPSVPSPQPQAPVQEGPSDFTRIIQAGGHPTAQPVPAEPSKAPAPGPAAVKPAVPIGLVVLLASLAVLVIGIILFFALRR